MHVVLPPTVAFLVHAFLHACMLRYVPTVTSIYAHFLSHNHPSFHFGLVPTTIPSQTDSSYNHPLMLHKFKIGTIEKPKIAMVGEYWDQQTSQEIQSLLWDYEDLFPKTFSELKGIKGVMGEMKIELKLRSKLVRHIPYHLNPRVKEKDKKEISKMLEDRLIL
jgi:hypothetical protein